MSNVQIHDSWFMMLQEEFEKPYFRDIKNFILEQKAAGKTVYPPGPAIFKAFNSAPFDKVKVVIIGQDPYHGANQAHGLSFSVLPGIKPPPSLVNIYKEMESDLGLRRPQHGYLQSWADQGVLLLNAVLTVNAGEPGSHRKAGWEYFTDAVIHKLSQQQNHLVFLLWGAFAQGKKHLIDPQKHLVLESPHPSPFSARKGFFGCKHFSKTNHYLTQHGIRAINWQLEDSPRI